jgi:hypothetical protein
MALGFGTRYIHEGKGQPRLTFREVIDCVLTQVDPCAFTSDDLVQVLLKEMEDLFTARFGETTFEDDCRISSNVSRSEGRQEACSGLPPRGALSQDTPFKHLPRRPRTWSWVFCTH